MAHSPLGRSGRAAALASAPELAALAGALSVTPQGLALAWLLKLDPVVVPIPGATRASSVDSAVRALEIELDDDAERGLGEALRRMPGRPGIVRRVVSNVRRLLGG